MTASTCFCTQARPCLDAATAASDRACVRAQAAGKMLASLGQATPSMNAMRQQMQQRMLAQEQAEVGPSDSSEAGLAAQTGPQLVAAPTAPEYAAPGAEVQGAGEGMGAGMGAMGQIKDAANPQLSRFMFQ